jgi:LDH2 family malate/lactate/ureidoglycolate dehydrogenase
MSDRTVSLEQLSGLGAKVLMGHGVPEPDAQLVAESLATADAWGHASHGMLRLPWYVNRLKSGVMQAVTQETTVLDLGALAVIDGHHGIGQVVTDRSCARAVERAKAHGIGAIAVRSSNHFGTAAYWTRRMADAGMVGVLTTNGSPAMAPWGGREKTVGTNPWSIATPGGTHGPVVLDIANTSVARGKIYAAIQKGEEIPATWATDANGEPTVDPRRAVDGILMPVGGHKGYGIAFMMDVLSGVLTGSGFATDVIGPYVPDQRSNCGHFVIAIDIDQVIGRDTFDERIDRLIDLTKDVPLASGSSEIFYPGEIENRALERARAEGVWIPAKTLEELQVLADEIDVPFQLDTVQTA